MTYYLGNKSKTKFCWVVHVIFDMKTNVELQFRCGTFKWNSCFMSVSYELNKSHIR